MNQTHYTIICLQCIVWIGNISSLYSIKLHQRKLPTLLLRPPFLLVYHSARLMGKVLAQVCVFEHWIFSYTTYFYCKCTKSKNQFICMKFWCVHFHSKIRQNVHGPTRPFFHYFRHSEQQNLFHWLGKKRLIRILSCTEYVLWPDKPSLWVRHHFQTNLDYYKISFMS